MCLCVFSINVFDISIDKKTIYNVGDEVRLSITLRNGYNQTRSRGGDQLRVRVFNTSLQASAAGYVKDHNNGTYTAFIRTFWPGQQTISVILSYRREAVRALYYTLTKVRSQSRLLLFSELHIVWILISIMYISLNLMTGPCSAVGKVSDHETISTVILLPSAESFKKGCWQLQAKVCARSTG